MVILRNITFYVFAQTILLFRCFQKSNSQRTIITPRLLFCLEWGSAFKQSYSCVEYTPEKCLNKITKVAVNARKQNDENPNSSVVAETVELLMNSSFDYEIMGRSWHIVSNYLNDEKRHCALNCKKFKRLNDNTNYLVTKLDWQSPKMSTENQSLLDLLYYNMLNREIWSSITIFPKFFLTLTIIKNLKRTPNLYLALRKNFCKTLLFQENETSGIHCAQQIDRTLSLPQNRQFIL